MQSLKGAREEAVQEATIKLINRYPDVASIILWAPRVIVDQNNVAATDGKVILVGNKFFDYEPDKEQPAILLHEGLHIALNHLIRFNRLLDGDREIYNIAADAIINGCIEGMGAVKLPSDAITLDTLPLEHGVSRDVQDWSTDSLYTYLLSLKRECLGKFMGKANDLVKGTGEGSDYTLDGVDPSIRDFVNTSDTTRETIWNGKMAGISSTNPFFRKIRDSYVVHTKWEPILRRFLISQFSKERQKDYRRPSRRMIALATEGIEIFSPHSRRVMKTNKLGIVRDTSGSIDEEILGRFTAEIDAIQTQLKVDIELVDADDRVCATHQLPYSQGKLSDLVKKNKVIAKGGGGTDFEPAIKYLLGNGTNVIVYLTDMEGNFGNFNLKSIVWAATTEDKVAPYGRTIYIW